MAQPAARLTGRLRHGLSPWRRRSAPRLGLPLPRTTGIWSERWRAPGERVRGIESALRRSGGVVFSGGDFERWDLHVRGGMLGSMRMRMAVEEHGSGRQLLKVRAWPRCSRIGVGVALAFGALAAGAALASAWVVAAVMAAVVAVVVTSIVKDCATAAGVLRVVLEGEIREAQGEFQPVSEPVAGTQASVNGHHPEVAAGRDSAIAANGGGELPAHGMALGAPVRISERRIELREGDE